MKVLEKGSRSARLQRLLNVCTRLDVAVSRQRHIDS